MRLWLSRALFFFFFFFLKMKISRLQAFFFLLSCFLHSSLYIPSLFPSSVSFMCICNGGGMVFLLIPFLFLFFFSHK